MVYEYNTSRKPLILKEYGRNIQKLVDFIKSIEDKEKRTEYAHTLISLMKQISPQSKETQENEQKFWDDLFIVGDFNIDIDAPYPVPEENILTKKPQKLNYHNYEVRFRHYGRNIELLIKQAIEMEDKEKQEEAIVYIGKLMKTFHASWSKDVVEDDVIMKNIKLLSNQQLDLKPELLEEGNLFNPLYKDSNKNKSHKQNKKNSQGRQNNRRRRNN